MNETEENILKQKPYDKNIPPKNSLRPWTLRKKPEQHSYLH